MIQQDPCLTSKQKLHVRMIMAQINENTDTVRVYTL